MRLDQMTQPFLDRRDYLFSIVYLQSARLVLNQFSSQSLECFLMFLLAPHPFPISQNITN